MEAGAPGGPRRDPRSGAESRTFAVPGAVAGRRVVLVSMVADAEEPASRWPSCDPPVPPRSTCGWPAALGRPLSLRSPVPAGEVERAEIPGPRPWWPEPTAPPSSPWRIPGDPRRIWAAARLLVEEPGGDARGRGPAGQCSTRKADPSGLFRGARPATTVPGPRRTAAGGSAQAPRHGGRVRPPSAPRPGGGSAGKGLASGLVRPEHLPEAHVEGIRPVVPARRPPTDPPGAGRRPLARREAFPPRVAQEPGVNLTLSRPRSPSFQSAARGEIASNWYLQAQFLREASGRTPVGRARARDAVRSPYHRGPRTPQARSRSLALPGLAPGRRERGGSSSRSLVVGEGGAFSEGGGCPGGRSQSASRDAEHTATPPRRGGDHAILRVHAGLCVHGPTLRRCATSR